MAASPLPHRPGLPLGALFYAALTLAAAILVGAVPLSGYVLNILMQATTYAIAVIGLTVVLGLCGQINLAQAGFFGIGAYAVGLGTTSLGLDFWLCLGGGLAVALQMRGRGLATRTASDVAEVARQGHNQEAAELLRAAGRNLGRVLAGVVNLLNPGSVVIGGELSEVRDYLAGIQQEIYARALPLAAAQLHVLRASLGRDAGIKGAAALVVDELLAPRPILGTLTT